jgi:hypothetical protein
MLADGQWVYAVPRILVSLDTGWYDYASFTYNNGWSAAILGHQVVVTADVIREYPIASPALDLSLQPQISPV